MNMNIKKIINKIKTHNDFSLESLEKLIPTLGLNGEKIHEQPVELSDFFDKGLKIWQYPNQLSKFANFIYNLSVKSYLEIGCRWGGTFIFNNEILIKKDPDLKSYACDIIDKSDLLKTYSGIRRFEYIHGSSQNLKIIQYFKTIKPHMVFIDGDHSYESVKSDFTIFENMQDTKYIVFHDIVSDACKGVVSLWNKLKNDKRFNNVEFIDQYDSVQGSYLGIGILIRK